MEAEQEKLLKELQGKELKTEGENLISLCKDFIQDAGTATTTQDISRLLNNYIEDETLFPNTMRDVVYSMTRLITFLALLQESASRVNRLEFSINTTKL